MIMENLQRRDALSLELGVDEGTTRGPYTFHPLTILLTSGYNVGTEHWGHRESWREGVSVPGDSLHNIKSQWKKVLLLVVADVGW